MIRFSYKDVNLSEYDAEELGRFFEATYYYLSQTLPDNSEAALKGIKSFDSAETKILKYFAECATLFQLLDEHPEFIRKVHELDYMALQKFGVQHYAIYADSLIENEIFSIYVPNLTFIKKFNIKCLFPSQQYLPIMLNEIKKIPSEAKRTLKELSDDEEDLKVLPKLIEKLNKDLQKIQDLKMLY